MNFLKRIFKKKSGLDSSVLLKNIINSFIAYPDVSQSLIAGFIPKGKISFDDISYMNDHDLFHYYIFKGGTWRDIFYVKIRKGEVDSVKYVIDNGVGFISKSKILEGLFTVCFDMFHSHDPQMVYLFLSHLSPVFIEKSLRGVPLIDSSMISYIVTYYKLQGKKVSIQYQIIEAVKMARYDIAEQLIALEKSG